MEIDRSEVMFYNKTFLHSLRSPSHNPVAKTGAKAAVKATASVNIAENNLVKDFERVFDMIRFILLSDKSITENIQTVFPNIFELRMLLLSNFQIQLPVKAHTQDIYPLIEKDVEDMVKKNNHYGEFGENLLFAIRCSKRAFDFVGKKIKEHQPQQIIQNQFPQVYLVSYNQFLSTLSFAMPDKYQLTTFINWINSSLVIEFGVSAMLILKNENIKVNKSNLEELASLIADAGQTYLGCIISSHSKEIESRMTGITEEIRNEEMKFADLGIENTLLLP